MDRLRLYCMKLLLIYWTNFRKENYIENVFLTRVTVKWDILGILDDGTLAHVLINHICPLLLRQH